VTDTEVHACPFCSPIEQQRIFTSNEYALAVWDGFPVAQGHALIIPRRHLASFFETSTQERQAILELLDMAKLEIERRHRPDAYNIGINDGPAAGQTVNHLHIHLIPRYPGDVPDPRGGVRWVIPDKADYWSQPDD